MSIKKNLKLRKTHQYFQTGENINKLFSELGVNDPREIAKTLGCKPPNVRRLLRGEALPTTQQLLIMRQKSGKSMESILGEEEPREDQPSTLIVNEADEEEVSLFRKLMQRPATCPVRKILLDQLKLLLQLSDDCMDLISGVYSKKRKGTE